MTLDDGKFIVKWRNDDFVKSHCMTRPNITEESNKEFFKANVETGKYKQFMVERTDAGFGVASYPIATVYLKDMDYENRRCELCIFTSCDSEWHSEGQSIAIKMLLKKAFEEYGMHKVYSYVFYKFPEEVELLKKAGFSAECILKNEAINKDGEYEDVVRLSIFKTSEL
jgi:RimJ/RimL family protein N-acetyltransferase